MIQVNFYLNNSIVDPPKNWEEMLIELNYGKDQFPNANVVSITDFIWLRKNFDFFIKYIDDGLSGGPGIFEAVPLRIEIQKSAQKKVVFDGYVDLTDGMMVYDKKGILPRPDGTITAKALSMATVDWVNQVAGGFTFEYLASPEYSGKPGAIDSSYYRWMPYTNSGVPDYEQSAMATLMVFALGDRINTLIEEVADLITDLSNPFTAANAIIKALIKVGYLIVLIATLIKCIEDMYKYLISPVKYHAGMYVRDLMERAASYLNMSFSSDIWAADSPYYNEFIIPEKQYNALDKTGVFGFLTPNPNEQIGYYKGSFASLLEAMKIKYNAKIVVTLPVNGVSATNQGTINLVRRDKNVLPPVYKLPDTYVPEYTYNTNELISNTEISFQTDAQDTNTLQYYQGTIFQVICQPKTFVYRPYVMFKNFDQYPIPFSRAIVKTSLTTPEKIIGAFLKVVSKTINVLIDAVNGIAEVANKITGFLNRVIKALRVVGINVNWKIKPIPKIKKVNFSLGIENRLGMMMLSADNFGVAKIFLLKEGTLPKYNKIDPLNDGWDPFYKTQDVNTALQSAKAMWDRFYYVNSFIPASINPAYSDRPTGNQFKIQDWSNIPFTWDDFVSVAQNNRIYDAKGRVAILESLKFNPRIQKADMRIRFQQVYTLNLEETYLNPTGN